MKITLKHPIKQGETSITEITLRKPTAGELRGVKLLDVMQMDMAAHAILLSRIAYPLLSDAQINSLDLEDLIQIMTGVLGFFVGADSQTA